MPNEKEANPNQMVKTTFPNHTISQDWKTRQQNEITYGILIFNQNYGMHYIIFMSETNGRI